MLKTDSLSDPYLDLDSELTSCLVGRNIHCDAPDEMGNYHDSLQVFELTHDVSNDIIVRIAVASVCYRDSYLNKHVDASSVLPWLPEMDLDEELAEDTFMVGRQYELYMVQNDCELLKNEPCCLHNDG